MGETIVFGPPLLYRDGIFLPYRACVWEEDNLVHIKSGAYRDSSPNTVIVIGWFNFCCEILVCEIHPGWKYLVFIWLLPKPTDRPTVCSVKRLGGPYRRKRRLKVKKRRKLAGFAFFLF